MTKPVISEKELKSINDSFYKDMPDYTKFDNGSDLLEALGDQGMKWAAAFCQITKKNLDIDLDLMYVMGWFANAIEHSSDVRKWRNQEENFPEQQDRFCNQEENFPDQEDRFRN
jgi:hypothetical protein